MPLPARFAPLMSGMLLAGCAAPASYPSLLPRAAESPETATAEPAVAEPTTPATDPALDAKVAAAMRTLEERIAAFDVAAARATSAVAAAAGSAPGSERWLDAQVVLAELDSLRSATLDVATGLDDVAGERALALAPDYPTLDSAVERARVAAAAQATQIAALQARLAPA